MNAWKVWTKIVSISVLLIAGGINASQEYEEYVPEFKKKIKPFKFKFSGSIRVDAFFDSRQTWDYWEGLDLNSPKKRALDPNKRDINDKGQFNVVPWPLMQVDIFGPEVWKAKSSALIKADIVGRTFNVEDDVVVNTYSLPRVKHAFFQLDWENTSLRVGRYYHPLVMPECVPDTVSVNGGELFEPFQYSRMIQVRHKFQPFEIVAAVGRIPHINDARQAISPHFYIRLNAYYGRHFFCVGTDFRAIVPRLETDKEAAVPPLTTEYGYKDDTSIKSVIPFIGVHLQKGNSAAKFRLTYAQNAPAFGMIGGYAVCKWDETTDLRRYTKLRCLTCWADFSNTTEKRELGLFLGYAKNLGSRYKIARDEDGNLIIPFGWLTDADHAFRIQPRLRFFRGPVILGLELEYTGAAFGTTNDYGKVCGDTYTVGNARILASIIYLF